MQYIGGETNRLEGQTIGERLRKLREGKKPPCGSCPAWRSATRANRLENSNQRTASLPVMMRLANALGVSLDYLAGMDKLYGGTEGQYKPVSMEELGGTPHTDEHQPLSVEHELAEVP